MGNKCTLCAWAKRRRTSNGELFRLERPQWKNVAGTQDQESMPRAARR